MSATAIEWLANFGTAGVVIILVVTGQLVPGFIYKDACRANERYEDALNVERQRNSDLQQMNVTSTKALNAVAAVAEENRQHRRRRKGASDVSLP